MNTKQTIDRRRFLRLAGVTIAAVPLIYIPKIAKADSTIVSVNSLNNVGMVNSTWGRPVALPAAWSKVRVGLLLHFGNTGGALASSPVLAVGLCHGTTQMYGDSTTAHFAGLKTVSVNWVDVGCGGASILGSVAVQASVVVAGSETLSGNICTDARYAFSATQRHMYFVDITKGSPNYTFNLFTVIVDACGADVTVSQFLTQVGLASPSFSSHSFGTPVTLAVNEGANGTLDTMNVFWNRVDAQCNLGAVAVAVLA